MLSAVTELLRDRGLLAPDEEPGYTIMLVTEQVMNIAAQPRGRDWFHIRVKDRDAQPAEFENCMNARRAFPRHAPEVIERRFHGRWEIILIRGISHRPVHPGALVRRSGGLAREIVGFLEGAPRGAAFAQPCATHREYLRGILAREPDPACVGILREWIEAPELDDLPHIPQHGDFVTNNLGLTGSGLVVFDWEDFGRIAFPGLDLCTILASDSAFDVAALRALADGNVRLAPVQAGLLERGCPAAGLTTELFRRLVPLYLVLFLVLKREYGKAIGERVLNLIHALRNPAGADIGPARA